MGKILANDGISNSGVEALEAMGYEVSTTNVAQVQLENHINENKINVLLVRSATTVRKALIDACPGLKIIGRGGVGMD
ncbi:MAG: 3-phosphoglycerate dehydrogenase, partial [Flavobacteriaceae bacterium]|nr:3-phosphoglycerate dehydrogenase [Flavobacteriaceae bacterium]